MYSLLGHIDPMSLIEGLLLGVLAYRVGKLEEYQIQEIARLVFLEDAADIV